MLCSVGFYFDLFEILGVLYAPDPIKGPKQHLARLVVGWFSWPTITKIWNKKQEASINSSKNKKQVAIKQGASNMKHEASSKEKETSGKQQAESSK